MNNTGMLKELGVRKPTTTEKWQRLIQARTDMITPWMESMTLERLGNGRFPSYWSTSNGPYHNEICNEKIWPKKSNFNSKTQGIFILDTSALYDNLEVGDKSSMILWGFTRSKQYVSANIGCHLRKNTDPSYQDAGHMITVFFELEPIQVVPSSLNALASSPQREEFWNHLGETLEGWYEKTRERLDRLTPGVKVIELENQIAAVWS
jgi:hypothetical protein